MAKYILKLYVISSTPHAALAVANLQRICDEALGDNYELTVVDILKEPQLAEEHKVLATPTLVKESPPPSMRVIGDLSDESRVLFALGLH
jgi:circadian clock protein KaiB